LEEVIFLGHVFTEEEIKIDPQKLKAITEWSRPSNVIEIKSFIGLAAEGSFRIFQK